MTEAARWLLFVPAADAGGISTWVRGLAVGLRKLGREVLVVRWRDISSPYSDKNRNVFEGLPVTDVRFDGLDKASRIAEAFEARLDVRDGDRVVSQVLREIAPVVERIGSGRRVAHVEVLHSDAPVVYRIAALALPTCDLYAVMNEAMAERLRRRVLEPWGADVPVVTAPGGVEVRDVEVPGAASEEVTDPDASAEGGAESGPARPLRLLYVGRLSYEEKRLGDLALAAAKLEGLGIDYTLTVVGPGDAARLRRRLEELGVRAPVRLAGRLPHADVLELFQSHDAWLQTSPREGAPIALAEAMAHGTVPVATRVGNCAEVIRDGENGYLVDVGDVDAMAGRVALLARDRALLETLAREARRTAREELSVERRAARLAEAVEDLDSGPPGREGRRRRGPRGPLERAWIPNWAVRGARRAWRLARGRPADLGSGERGGKRDASDASR